MRCNVKKLYKYDTHTHTAEVSLCGVLSASELVEQYHSFGYDGIVITDHLNEEYISSLERNHDWESCMRHFLQGYRRAAARGRELGLNVMLGAEIRFAINENDYLIYGFDEDFLLNNSYLHRLNPWEFFKKFGDELLIVHAHPFRNGNEDVFIECVHGVEVVNGNPRHDNCNQKALELYFANPNLHPFCGSDAHQIEDVGRVWMVFEEHITNSKILVKAINSKNNRFRCCAKFALL